MPLALSRTSRPETKTQRGSSWATDVARCGLHQNTHGGHRGRPPNRPRLPVQRNPQLAPDSDTSDPSAVVTTDQESPAPPVSTRYRLRRDRVPRFCCRTCGLRNCTCNHLIQPDSPIKPREDLMMVDKSSAPSMNLVSRLVIRAEKTYTGLGRSQSSSVQHILTKLAELEVPKPPCPQFKEWTHDH